MDRNYCFPTGTGKKRVGKGQVTHDLTCTVPGPDSAFLLLVGTLSLCLYPRAFVLSVGQEFVRLFSFFHPRTGKVVSAIRIPGERL